MKRKIKPRNPYAKELNDERYFNKIVPSKKKEHKRFNQKELLRKVRNEYDENIDDPNSPNL